MDEQCCGNCRFWADDEDPEFRSGRCRRFPPINNLHTLIHFAALDILDRMKGGGDDRIRRSSMNSPEDASIHFPGTMICDWCGEWQALPQVPPAAG